MSTVQVSLQPRKSFTNLPGSLAVSRAVELMQDVSGKTGEVQAMFIAWYGDTWSQFVRTSGTDFTPSEWVKRTFKPVAKAFEASLKNINGDFDVKHQTYKNVKSTLARAAFAMLTLETVEDGKKRYKTLVELKRDLKGKGTGDTIAESIVKACKALVPTSEDGEPNLSLNDYAEQHELIDDMPSVVLACEALSWIVGLDRMQQIVAQLRVQHVDRISSELQGKVETDQGE